MILHLTPRFGIFETEAIDELQSRITLRVVRPDGSDVKDGELLLSDCKIKIPVKDKRATLRAYDFGAGTVCAVFVDAAEPNQYYLCESLSVSAGKIKPAGITNDQYHDLLLSMAIAQERAEKRIADIEKTIKKIKDQTKGLEFKEEKK